MLGRAVGALELLFEVLALHVPLVVLSPLELLGTEVAVESLSRAYMNLFDVPVELALGFELLVAKLAGEVGFSCSGWGSGGSFFHFFYYKFVGAPYLF